MILLFDTMKTISVANEQILVAVSGVSLSDIF